MFGDPTKEGLFALRLKFPAGYAVPPHTHPVDEVVTVVSGFFALPPGMAHFAYIDEETVVQITTNGPWGLKYVNPADDPQKSQ